MLAASMVIQVGVARPGSTRWAPHFAPQGCASSAAGADLRLSLRGRVSVAPNGLRALRVQAAVEKRHFR
jgi:hypothetical protein